MKNFLDYRGGINRTIFDIHTKQFIVQRLPHPFAEVCDIHSKRLLDDIGVEVAITSKGENMLACRKAA